MFIFLGVAQSLVTCNLLALCSATILHTIYVQLVHLSNNKGTKLMIKKAFFNVFNIPIYLLPQLQILKTKTIYLLFSFSNSWGS